MSVNLFIVRPKGLNVGNDAIYLGLKVLLANHFPQVPNIITLPATGRYESSAGNSGLTSSTIHTINQYGHGVIVGGGNLYENGELDLNLEAIEKLSPPMMLFSLSRGRVYDRSGKLVDRTDTMSDVALAALNSRADFSLARDAATLDYLRSIGITSAKMGGCPTLFLNKIASRLPEIPKESTGLALISIRTPSLMNIPLARQARVAADIREIKVSLERLGYRKVHLLCHDSRDIAFAASFGDIPYIYQGDVYDYLSLINNSSVLVSFRVHASIPALSFGKNFVNISYDERASSLMDTLGLGPWDLNLLETSNLAVAVTERLAELETLSSLRGELTALWQDLDTLQNEEIGKFEKMVSSYFAGL